MVQGQARDPNAAPPSGRRRCVAAVAVVGGGGDGEGGGGGLTVQGLPIIKPPYGRITALDLNKGELVWQIAHGETPDNIKNHPALEGRDDPADRPHRSHRRARDQVAADRRRRRLLHRAERQARRDAARLRQEDRQRSRRGLHGSAADRIADDLHARRQAIPHGVHRRAGTSRRTGGVTGSVRSPRGRARGRCQMSRWSVTILAWSAVMVGAASYTGFPVASLRAQSAAPRARGRR